MSRAGGDMASVREHYDVHLGPIYGWMLGDFSTAKEAARTELRAVGLYEGAGGAAIDLGAGVGAHAIALAEAGYSVTALDTCAQLLEELRGHGGNRAIRSVHDDLLHLRRHCDVPWTSRMHGRHSHARRPNVVRGTALRGDL